MLFKPINGSRFSWLYIPDNGVDKLDLVAQLFLVCSDFCSLGYSNRDYFRNEKSPKYSVSLINKGFLNTRGEFTGLLTGLLKCSLQHEQYEKIWA